MRYLIFQFDVTSFFTNLLIINQLWFNLGEIMASVGFDSAKKWVKSF